MAQWRHAVFKMRTIYLKYATNVYVCSSTENAKTVIRSVGARIWPTEGARIADQILHRMWSFKKKLQAKVKISIVSTMMPRTLIHECIRALQEMWRLVQVLLQHNPDS